MNKMAAPAARFQRRVLESPSHELLQALVDLEPPVSWNTVSKHCLPLPEIRLWISSEKWNLTEGMETVGVGATDVIGFDLVASLNFSRENIQIPRESLEVCMDLLCSRQPRHP